MVGRKKKTKICDKVSLGEDRISQLPDSLICDNILCHLSTKDAVRTSVLSTRWRKLWRWVPGLDLDTDEFSNFDAFVRFVESFFDSHRESWIRKLRLALSYRCDLTSWIAAVTTRRIQHIDVWDIDSEKMCSKKMNQISYTFVPECLLSSVKSVEIKTKLWGYVAEMKLVSYFLENSVILEKLTLESIYRPNVEDILNKLLKIPRRSITCQVVVN